MKILSLSFIQLVAALNDGQYHDGTTLGQQLKMTRSAVWKNIKKLEQYDIKIDSIKGKGYALLEPLILLNKKTIASRLEYKNIDLQIFETISSTNDYLKNNLIRDKIQICIAEEQTQGRGRLQRKWYCPFAQNIYLTCAYPFHQDVSELAGLSLVVSLAIVKVLETYGLPLPLSVKWPNDIIYDAKKMAGILIEMQAESHGISHAIIGIGININMLPEKNLPISQPWTSLRNAIGYYVDRNQFCIALINSLMTTLNQFKSQGLSSFIDEWNTVHCLMNKEITLQYADRKIRGQVKGIDSRGHLLLQLKNGITQSFSSGDTTIIK